MKPENWHRRHAVQIVAALPEETEDALAVLRLATQLVTGFLSEADRPERPIATVVSIRSDECA
jgi:hypothetical protein